MTPGYSKAVAVTPSDTVPVAGLTIKALWIGGAGNVTIVPASGPNTPVTFTAIPAGYELRVSPKLVRATATTATLIVAMGD